MHLTHQRTPVAGQRSPGRVQALAWSPGCLRLAVAGRDRVVQLFDERGERRDKFSTKPGDARGAPAPPPPPPPPTPPPPPPPFSSPYRACCRVRGEWVTPKSRTRSD